ncbi:MAG: acylphosphatase [Planctomycetota bacterium]|jgi:acylphosphatase
MDATTKHIIFIGRVQGVGFRFTAHRVASRYQLTGWVRNLPDGTVEMVAQGPPDSISDCVQDIEESFTGYLRETKVDEITTDAHYEDFRITF